VRELLAAACLIFPLLANAGNITIAAASDLKFAMDEIVAAFKTRNPGDEVNVIYGSSGKFYTQIQQGGPFDLYFSADIEFPRQLAKSGFAASEVKPYGIGRLVLWSTALDARQLTLANLTNASIRRVAIANPQHAPYGKRAEEALRSNGLWSSVEPKLVFGENIAQTAQFVQTGNAQVGLIALSLALSPELARLGGYTLIPEHLHKPLEQGFIITRRAAANPLAKNFADHMQGMSARAIMTRYGFSLPTDKAGK
jgi:molybdate transport system substrate-binding protein